MSSEKEISAHDLKTDAAGIKHKNRFRLAFILACSILFIIIVWIVWIKKNPYPDQLVFDSVKSFITPGMTKVMLFITFFGKHIFLIPANLLLIAYFLYKKQKKSALQVLFIALSSLSIMSLTKRILQRHRPPDALVDGVTNFSFPSGHAFMSIAFYGLIIWYISQKKEIRPGEKICIAVLAIFILLIGFSRIYLRLHYTTDVIGGFCLGTLWLFFCLWWTADKPNPKRV